MTTDPTYRATTDPATDSVSVRQPADEDGLMDVRMPIATAGEVRNEGDTPLTQRELYGMAEQINNRAIGVFVDHGSNDVGGPTQYGTTGKLGEWVDAEVDTTASPTELVATARMMDPETLPAAARPVREVLAVIKEQVKRGLTLSASIGWQDDEDAPGGVDLWEVSLVGIPADPRTTSNDEAVVARSVAQAAESFDMAAFVRGLREGGMRPLGPPEDPDRFETFDQCVAALSDDPDISESDAEEICGAWENAKSEQSARATYEVGDTTIEITPPEPMVNAAQEALDAKQRFDNLSDCGTGVGEDRARQIINDEVGPDVIEEVAGYLTSHEEDVNGITDPPTDWSEAEWTDGCGPVQYALWGGTATGTALNWAQRKTNEVAEARGEELPYPERTLSPERMAGPCGRNLDDPQFSEGDAVVWSWDGEPVHGRVAGIHEQFTPPEASEPITGDEGEAVYSIHEYDEDVEAFRRQNVAKPESSLNESQMEMPPATDENFQSMSTDSAADDGGTTDAQDASDGETTTRAPGDLTEEDLATFTATHYDGLDEADLMEAADAADAEYVGEAELEAAFDMLSVGTGAEYEAVQDAVTAIMPDDNEMGEDDDDMMDDDDDDDMDEQAGDVDELKQRITELENEYQETRELIESGDFEADVPGEQAAAEAEETGEQSADADDGDADSDDAETETRDTTDDGAGVIDPDELL